MFSFKKQEEYKNSFQSDDYFDLEDNGGYFMDLKNNPYLTEFSTNNFNYITTDPDENSKPGYLNNILSKQNNFNNLDTKLDLDFNALDNENNEDDESVNLQLEKIVNRNNLDNEINDGLTIKSDSNTNLLRPIQKNKSGQRELEDNQENIKSDLNTDSVHLPKHTPSNLRVSTMTAISNINVIIKLDELYKNLVFKADEKDETYPYIKNCQVSSEPLKGYLVEVKSKRAKSKVKNKNCFQNQATIIVTLSNDRQVNLKIFRNGKIQMTGLKSEEEGYVASNTLIDKILEIYETVPSLITSENKQPKISDFSIVLINSDFSAGFRIKRERLYELLFKSGMYVSYEPDIYPGVNAKFYWNKGKGCNYHDGICRCSNICDGKGGGMGDGDCKKVTIATFQSGNVIITGARQNIQTQDAYHYINKVFADNMANIMRTSTLEDELDIPKKETLKDKKAIPISKIINFAVREKLKLINL